MKEEEKMKGKHPSQENKHFQKPSKRLLLFFFLIKETFLFGPLELKSGNHPWRLILKKWGLKTDEIEESKRGGGSPKIAEE